MKTQRTFWITTITAIALAVTAVGLQSSRASAESEPQLEADEPCETSCRRGQRSRGAGRLGRMTEGLDLDEEQQALFDAAREQQRTSRSERRHTRHGSLGEVMSALMDGDVDAEAVHARVDERFDQARADAHASADAMLAFLGSLDDEQLQQLVEQVSDAPCARRGERGDCACGRCGGEAECACGCCPRGR